MTDAVSELKLETGECDIDGVLYPCVIVAGPLVTDDAVDEIIDLAQAIGAVIADDSDVPGNDDEDDEDDTSSGQMRYIVDFRYINRHLRFTGGTGTYTEEAIRETVQITRFPR